MRYKFLKDPAAVALFAITAVGLPSALWMLIAPLNWYINFPWNISDFGPFNVHMVRDLGAIYLTASIACMWAGLSPQMRIPVVAIATIFFCAHALVHVFDTLRGHVDYMHFLFDFPFTYLPALLLLWVLYILHSKQDNAQ